AQGVRVLNLGMVAANDNFSDEIVLTGTSVMTSGHVLGATGEPDEPDHGGKGFPISIPVTSVWWERTASDDVPVVISTFGSDFDTTLAVYAGTDIAALTPVASSDDSGGLQSQVKFTVVAGATYHIAVDGALQWTGRVQLNLDLDAPVP